MIPETGVASASPEGVKRVVFCTGKVYYELIRERKNRGMEATVAITRVEQVKALQQRHTCTYLRRCVLLCVLKPFYWLKQYCKLVIYYLFTVLLFIVINRN